ncbi:MAG: hypothetical protein PHS02_00290 [Candidatus ainarchaeum sp.]|nr:hypothetical protein [Candidatus ainarchaeum sp.]
MVNLVVPKPVKTTSVSVFIEKYYDLCEAKKDLNKMIENDPEHALPALKNYQNEIKTIKNALYGIWPTILETARNSSPYYEYSKETREQAYKEFKGKQIEIKVDSAGAMTPHITISVPGSNYYIGISWGEGGRNLTDGKKGVGVEFARIK